MWAGRDVNLVRVALLLGSLEGDVTLVRAPLTHPSMMLGCTIGMVHNRFPKLNPRYPKRAISQ